LLGNPAPGTRAATFRVRFACSWRCVAGTNQIAVLEWAVERFFVSRELSLRREALVGGTPEKVALMQKRC
jgi:hypothetical protein